MELSLQELQAAINFWRDGECRPAATSTRCRPK